MATRLTKAQARDEVRKLVELAVTNTGKGMPLATIDKALKGKLTPTQIAEAIEFDSRLEFDPNDGTVKLGAWHPGTTPTAKPKPKRKKKAKVETPAKTAKKAKKGATAKGDTAKGKTKDKPARKPNVSHVRKFGDYPSIRQAILAYLEEVGDAHADKATCEAIARWIKPDTAWKDTHFHYYLKIARHHS